MAKSHSNIINEVVANAADIMEQRAEYNALVAEQFAEKGDRGRAERLAQINQRIIDAIVLMREFDGCWA